MADDHRSLFIAESVVTILYTDALLQHTYYLLSCLQICYHVIIKLIYLFL